MGRRELRTRWLAAGIVPLLLSAPAAARDAGPRADGGPARKRLDLGLYGRPYAGAGSDPYGLRFESWVDVESAPAPTLDDTMAVWWKHFDLGEPAVYGRGYDLRPSLQPNAVNLVPLFQKLYDKLRKRR